MVDMLERFWSKVEHSRGCWEWTGGKDRGGYGRLKIGGKNWSAHRVAYMLAKPLMFDSSLHVLHSCDNPGCCRPGHMFQGTQLDNMRDRDAKGRRTPLRGELHGRAKLTTEQVLAIRDDLRLNRRIAAEYGVSAYVVGCIKRRKSWKHL